MRADRTHRQDWIRAGLAALGRDGDLGLTIDRACERLGRTKGSFYHHFGGIEGYHDAVLAAFEEAHTVHGGRVLQADATSAGARMALLVPGQDFRMELAVRAWALRDARARAVIARLDRRRLDYLAALHAAAGAPPARALALSRLEYCAFLGAQQLYGGLETAAAGDLEATLHRALERAAEEA